MVAGAGPAPGPQSGQCRLPPGQAVATKCPVPENKQVPVSAPLWGDACVWKVSVFLLLSACTIITIITFFIRHRAVTSELGGLPGPLPRSSAASQPFRFLQEGFFPSPRPLRNNNSRHSSTRSKVKEVLLIYRGVSPPPLLKAKGVLLEIAVLCSRGGKKSTTHTGQGNATLLAICSETGF